MKFGMPALIEVRTPEELAAHCHRLGLSFVELNTNFPDQQVHLLDPERLNALSEKYDIFWTIHLNDEMPVADFCPSVAQGYCQAALDTIALAKKIRCRVLNMHISEGAHYTTPQRIIYFYEAYRQEYLEGIRRFRDLCQEAIGDSGIRICMENSKAYFDFQKEALELLLESPVFCLTLDIGHSHCSGYQDDLWIRSHGIRHMHMHDARGSRQDHQPLGQGEMDIAGYLDLARKQDCTVLLEVKTLAGLEASVVWLRENA